MSSLLKFGEKKAQDTDKNGEKKLQEEVTTLKKCCEEIKGKLVEIKLSHESEILKALERISQLETKDKELEMKNAYFETKNKELEMKNAQLEAKLNRVIQYLSKEVQEKVKIRIPIVLDYTEGNYTVLVNQMNSLCEGKGILFVITTPEAIPPELPIALYLVNLSTDRLHENFNISRREKCMASQRKVPIIVVRYGTNISSFSRDFPDESVICQIIYNGSEMLCTRSGQLESINEYNFNKLLTFINSTYQLDKKRIEAQNFFG